MKILIIGDAILDHYIYGKIYRQSPEDSTIPVVDTEHEEYRLGGCLNVAANIRSLSMSVSDGKDRKVFSSEVCSVFSPFTGKLLNARGILCDDSSMVNENRVGHLHPSTDELIKTRVINLETNKQIVRIDNRKKYKDDDTERFKENLVSFDGYDAVVVSDYNKGLIDDFVFSKLRDFKGYIFVDTKQDDLSKWAEFRDRCIVKINKQEYAKSIGHGSLTTLIVTEGKDGCMLYNQKPPTRGIISKRYGTKPISDAEVTGCGDVFLAGLVVEYVHSKDIDTAIKFANRVAGLNALKRGTTQIYLNKKERL